MLYVASFLTGIKTKTYFDSLGLYISILILLFSFSSIKNSIKKKKLIDKMSEIYTKEELEKAIKRLEFEMKSKYGKSSVLNIFTFYGFIFSPLIYFNIMTLKSVSSILIITEIVLLIGYLVFLNALKKRMP